MESPIIIPPPFLRWMRVMSALGIGALVLTREASPIFLAVACIGFLAGLLMDRYPERQLRFRQFETAAVFLLVAITLVDFFKWGSSLFVAVAHFLLLFQGIKLVGLKERKDALQVLMVSGFQVLSASTLSVDAWMALILVALIPAGISSLYWHEITRQQEQISQPFAPRVQQAFRKLLLLICVMAFPIIAVLAGGLFLVFPRLGFRTAFSGLGLGKSGYTEQVNLTSGSFLSDDATPVLWLKIIPERDRSRWKGYLRGTTLDAFDGVRWQRSPSGAHRQLAASGTGLFETYDHRRLRKRSAGLRQQITLVNTSGTTLFASPFVGEVRAPFATLEYRGDDSLRWTTGWRKPLQYEALSFDTPSAFRGSLDAYVTLPPRNYDAMRALLKDVCTARSSQAKAEQLATYLRENYAYSLSAEASPSNNPLEDFLFRRKAGSCGYFASAMAVLLRLEGIPSRVVAGYYKGVWNSRAEQYLIREKDAHAWVEVYFPQEGWVTFDPTPRIDSSAFPLRWFVRIQEYWDYANYQWDRTIIQYDLYSQVQIAEGVQQRSNRFSLLPQSWFHRLLRNSETRRDYLWTVSGVVGLGIGILVVLVMGYLHVKHRKNVIPRHPAVKAYEDFLERMAGRGYQKLPCETGMEFAERLNEPHLKTLALQATTRYYQARF